MGRHEVEFVIKTRDEATKQLAEITGKLGQVQNKLAQDLARSLQGSPEGFAAAMAERTSARASLEDDLFAATHTRRSVMVRQMDQEFGDLRDQWKNDEGMMDLLARTRAAKWSQMYKLTGDEAKTVSKEMPNVLSSLTKVVSLAEVAKLAFHGIAVGVRTWQLEQAKVKGDIIGINEAQLNVNASWRELAGSIPIVGRGIQTMLEALSDDSGLKRQVELIKKIRGVVADLNQQAEQYRRNTELLRAEARGASPAELEAIRQGHQATDTQTKLAAIRQQITDLDREIEEEKKKAEEDAKGFYTTSPFPFSVTTKTADSAPDYREMNALIRERRNLAAAYFNLSSEDVMNSSEEQFKLNQQWRTEQESKEKAAPRFRYVPVTGATGIFGADAEVKKNLERSNTVLNEINKGITTIARNTASGGNGSKLAAANFK